MMIKERIALLFVAFSFLFPGTIHASEHTPSIVGYPTSFTIPFAAKQNTFTLQFEVLNNGTQPITIANPQLIQIKHTPDKNVYINNIQTSFAYSQDSCTAGTAVNSASTPMAGNKKTSCHIIVTFQATGVQPNGGIIAAQEYQLSMSINTQGQPPSTLVSQPIQFNFATGEQDKTLLRTLTIRNLCNYPVWLGLSGDEASNIAANNTRNANDCQTDADCYPGSSCTSNRCYWNNLAPDNSGYGLAANGGTTTITVPAYNNGNGYFDKSNNYIPDEVIWAGSIAARVNCKRTGCQIADCGGGMGGCTAGSKFSPPVTTVDFTLTRTKTISTNYTGGASTDIYAVNLVNGITVPISMTPDGVSWGGQGAAYSCGSAGGVNTSAPLTACKWQFSPPSNDYRYVQYNTNTEVCQTDADCNSSRFVKYWGTGMICGLAMKAGSGKVRKQCGLPSPYYWTPNAVCNASSGEYNMEPFTCSANLPESTLRYSWLQQCSDRFTQSCYASGANSSCCGCNNWETIFPAQPFKACMNTSNKLWFAYVLPSILWMKDACPLAKVYPYDDASSRFGCNNVDANNMNVVNYTITFCPR